MGRAPCCDKAAVKRGPWSPDEDAVLKSYLEKNGTGGNWISLPKKAGLKRCGKSCRLRWLNYLRPDIKHGGFTEEEDNIIITLYNNIGSRWSVIASHLGGRTDNDVKNYFNTKLKKKLMAANTAATFSALTYMQSTCNPPAPYPPLPFGIKSEADCSGGSGSFPLPALVEGAHDSDFGYMQDPHRLFWELFGQLPPAGLFDEERCSGGYYAAPEDGSASVASSSATNMENSSSGSYGNWGVSGAAIMADDWFFPELGFGLPEALGGYQSHEKVGAEVAAETKPQGFCHGGRYS